MFLLSHDTCSKVKKIESGFRLIFKKTKPNTEKVYHMWLEFFII